jgi:alcohol dehydrogenase class IV
VDNESEGVAVLLALLNELLTTLAQPRTIRELGVREAEFERILPVLVSGAAQDHQLLTTVRVPGEDELAGLYRCAYDGLQVDF